MGGSEINSAHFNFQGEYNRYRFFNCTGSMFSVTVIIRNWIGARGVMVTVVGNGHGDTSSNPGWDELHFT